MSSFARKLRRINRAKVNFHAEAFAGKDKLMLMYAKDLVLQTPNVYEMAEDSVLVVADLTDMVGAAFVASFMGIDGSRFTEWRETIVANGKNPHPFVAARMPRHPMTLEALTICGFGVPPDWPQWFDAAPPTGAVLTLLKRDGRGALMQVQDYSEVESLGGHMVVMSSGVEREASS